MSTTVNAEVALTYSESANPLIFKLRTESFMERGASVQWLSAFPQEEEILFPPLTHMQATGTVEKFALDGQAWTIVTVEPTLP